MTLDARRRRSRLADLLTHLYRADPGARQPQALFGRRGRGREAAAQGRGLAAAPSRARADRAALSARHPARWCAEALARLDERSKPRTPDEHAARDAAEETLEKPIRLNDQRMERWSATLKAPRRAQRARPRLRRGQAAARCSSERAVRPDRRRRSGAAHAGAGRRPAAPGPDARDAAQAHPTAARFARSIATTGWPGFDAAALVEVIEHLDADRLPALERARVRPRPAGGRHRDHAQPRIQRAVRGHAAGQVPPPRPSLRMDPRRVPALGGARRPRAHGYAVRVRAASETSDPTHGAPTQMAVFTREAESA